MAIASKEILERTEAPTETQAPVEKLQIRNILCPVDFSDFSRRALRYAIGLSRHFGSRLFLQHTVQPSSYLLYEGPVVEHSAVQQNIASQLQRSREEIRRMLLSAGIDSSEVTVLLSDGEVTERILETISGEQIDLLVMGTHGHKGFSRLAVGSVTEGMIHRAVCPVLAVSRPLRDFVNPEDGERLRTILLATDFSAHSDRALAYALKWGWEWGARVVLFHAVQEVPSAMQGLADLFPEYNPAFEKQIAEAWDKIRHLIVKTQTGSVYNLNRDSMTWRRIAGRTGPSALETDAGKLLDWPKVQAGKPMKFQYSPLRGDGDLRTITTSPVIPETAGQGCEVVYEVRHGNPWEEILRVAEEKGADLIITGARGMERSAVPWGSVGSAIGENPHAADALHKSFHPWGSVSSAVVRDGRFPVLVVRELSA
jgi:universal stress protein A